MWTKVLILGALATPVQDTPVCVASLAEREQVRAVMLEALDGALKEKIAHLFDTWMKDPSSQPNRALIGANHAIKAYLAARANVVAWEPPICGK